jgi:hypothetical protein
MPAYDTVSTKPRLRTDFNLVPDDTSFTSGVIGFEFRLRSAGDPTRKAGRRHQPM